MKKIILCLLLVCSVICADAQKIEELFIKVPDGIIAQLEEAWRKDIVDLYNSGKTATLENTMQGRSILLKLTNDYMLLQSTERSMVELKLLPLVNNTYIICMIETIYAPIADSRVSFYSTEWKALPIDGLFSPVEESWFLKDDIDRMSPAFLDATFMLDMYLVKYSFSAESVTLSAEYMTPQHITEEYRNKVQPFLKTEPKIYEWRSGRFE